MKQSTTVDLKKIPHKIVTLTKLANANKDNELGQKISNYLQFIDGCDYDLDLYLGINAFAVQNGINLNEIVNETLNQ
jgi:hypothetical protein